MHLGLHEPMQNIFGTGRWSETLIALLTLSAQFFNNHTIQVCIKIARTEKFNYEEKSNPFIQIHSQII